MDSAMARLNGLTALPQYPEGDPEGCVLFLSGLSERTELTPESRRAVRPAEADHPRRLEEVLNDAAARRQTGNEGHRSALR
ncbi:MAG: hypothetical protein ABIU29_01420 [Chthoniobacterales bacterium]